MGKHYSADRRLNALYQDDDELYIPVWAWPLAAVVIMLVLVVR